MLSLRAACMGYFFIRHTVLRPSPHMYAVCRISTSGQWISHNRAGFPYLGRWVSHSCWISWISWILNFRRIDLTNIFEIARLHREKGVHFNRDQYPSEHRHLLAVVECFFEAHLRQISPVVRQRSDWLQCVDEGADSVEVHVRR